MKRASLAAILLVALVGCRLFSPRELSSVAVLPLDNASSDPAESDYLADGITRAVIARLAQVGLRVTPWESVRRYRDVTEPRAVARELNVDAVLLGSFQQEGDRVLATLTLVEAESGFIAWVEELEEPYEDLFQVQRRIAQGAASSLKRSLTGEEEEILAAQESGSVEAYDLYLQGAHLLQVGDRESTEIAFQYFSRASELDPSLVGAHLGLGTVHVTRYFLGWGSGASSLARAEASYERALTLDPMSMVARRGLALVNYFKGDSAAVLEQGDLAARIGRADDPETLLTRAFAFHWAGLPSLSVDLYRRAIEVDPGNPEARFQIVYALLFSFEAESAVEAGNEYIRRFGDDTEMHAGVAIAYWLLGDEEHAREHYLMVTSGDPHPAFYLHSGLFFDAHGDRDKAMQVWTRAADSIESDLAVNPDHAGMKSFLATYRTLLSGDTAFIDEAVRAYEAAGYYGWEVVFLALAQRNAGDLEGAVELLRDTVRHGRVIFFWEIYLPRALREAPPPSLRQLRAENEALKARYRELYGSDR